MGFRWISEPSAVVFHSGWPHFTMMANYIAEEQSVCLKLMVYCTSPIQIMFHSFSSNMNHMLSTDMACSCMFYIHDYRLKSHGYVPIHLLLPAVFFLSDDLFHPSAKELPFQKMSCREVFIVHLRFQKKHRDFLGPKDLLANHRWMSFGLEPTNHPFRKDNALPNLHGGHVPS